MWRFIRKRRTMMTLRIKLRSTYVTQTCLRFSLTEFIAYAGGDVGVLYHFVEKNEWNTYIWNDGKVAYREFQPQYRSFSEGDLMLMKHQFSLFWSRRMTMMTSWDKIKLSDASWHWRLYCAVPTPHWSHRPVLHSVSFGRPDRIWLSCSTIASTSSTT